ncbi:MAG: hypothetical protein U1F43_17895 [Myxococcota bacterium]
MTRKADVLPGRPRRGTRRLRRLACACIVAFAAGESAPGADDARALAAIGQELARRGQLRVMAFGTADEPEALADARLDAVADAIQAGGPCAARGVGLTSLVYAHGRRATRARCRPAAWRSRPPAAWRAADAPP